MATDRVGSSEELQSDAFPFETENPSGVPGVTKVEATVIAAIVGHVARTIQGVARLGNPRGILRAVADTVRTEASARAIGVDVEAGRREVILDLDVVVLYGFRIPTVVQEIRETVAKEVYDQIGLVAKEVNVDVVTIEFPPGAARSRVE
jgi:uncharacterized alkaline shock family protein YloU